MKLFSTLLERLVLVVVAMSVGSSYGSAQSKVRKPDLIFEGTIIKKSPEPAHDTGAIVPTFQIAKYRMTRMMKGKYNGRHIVVDTLYLADTHGLRSFQLGQAVCVRVWTVNKRLMDGRTNSPGIREPGARILVFYVGAPVLAAKLGKCTTE